MAVSEASESEHFLKDILPFSFLFRLHYTILSTSSLQVTFPYIPHPSTFSITFDWHMPTIRISGTVHNVEGNSLHILFFINSSTLSIVPSIYRVQGLKYRSIILFCLPKRDFETFHSKIKVDHFLNRHFTLLIEFHYQTNQC